ncbi:hypothetical protein DYB32_003935 [Aphanomyces invadans]|nr:hypothetical protein DYB32_003935 [Aphanomyces invadans]
MGHLGRAKKQLAQDSDLLKKQDRLLSAAEEKEKQHRRVVQQQQARRKLDSQIAAHKRDAVDKIAKLERKHALSISSERHQARFLQTVSPIPIFYLPARHTKETQALVDASMEAIEEKILAQRREIDAKKRSIEAESQRKIEALEAELARLVDTKPGDGPRDDVPTDVTTSPRDIASPSENDDVVQADEPSNRDDESEANEAKKDATVRDDNSPAAVEGASAQATPLSPQGASSSVEKPPSPVKKSPSPVKMPSPAKTPPSPVKAPSAEQQESCDDAIESKQEVSEGMDDDAKTESVEGDHAETKDASAAPALIPSKLKVVELRQHLKARGLDTKGLKDDLVKRLEQALAN